MDQNLFLKFLYFGFIFVSANIFEGLHVFLDRYHNDFPVKQATFLYLKLPIRLPFSVSFCFFKKGLLLLTFYLFTFGYLPNSSVEGDEVGIICKVSDRKALFSIKIKIK